MDLGQRSEFTCLPHDRLPTTGVIARVNCERSKSWTYFSNWWPIPRNVDWPILHNVFYAIQLSNSITTLMRNNTISSCTIKYYIIVTKKYIYIVSTETFLYPFSTIIYSLHNVSTYFMHINYSSTSKQCLCILFHLSYLVYWTQPCRGCHHSSLSTSTSSAAPRLYHIMVF